MLRKLINKKIQITWKRTKKYKMIEMKKKKSIYIQGICDNKDYRNKFLELRIFFA